MEKNMKKIQNDFFPNSLGIIVDNSYDQHSLNVMVDFCAKNGINYLKSQDNELDYLRYFKEIHYLSLPQESRNFIYLNQMEEIVGLELYSNTIRSINYEMLKKIEYLCIIYDEKTKIDFSLFESLKCLRIIDFPFETIHLQKELEFLELNGCKKIIKLNDINTDKLIELKLINLKNLEELNINPSGIEKIKFEDCKKISKIECFIGKCLKLIELDVITQTSDRNVVFENLLFLKNLSKLKYIGTNYRISDGNLRPLLRLEEANISEFYSNYNLSDKELPHKKVLIYNNGNIVKVDLDTLELRKEDKRILWLK